MRRIIIHDLYPEYSGYVGICGWQVQSTLLELESLLVTQKIIVKQIAGVSLKRKDEAIFNQKKKKTTM